MNKIIHHKWAQTHFLTFQCEKCKCVKKRIPDTIHLVFYYDRYGIQLPYMPECKTVFHNDKF